MLLGFTFLVSSFRTTDVSEFHLKSLIYPPFLFLPSQADPIRWSSYRVQMDGWILPRSPLLVNVNAKLVSSSLAGVHSVRHYFNQPVIGQLWSIWQIGNDHYSIALNWKSAAAVALCQLLLNINRIASDWIRYSSGVFKKLWARLAGHWTRSECKWDLIVKSLRVACPAFLTSISHQLTIRRIVVFFSQIFYGFSFCLSSFRFI